MESKYLRECVGTVLSQGIAETVMARPPDPVDYLARWLLHYLDSQKEDAAQVERQKALEAERTHWTEVNAAKRNYAALLIQREWVACLRRLRERRQRDSDLKTAAAKLMSELDLVEELNPDSIQIDQTDKGEIEVDKEDARTRAAVEFARARRMITLLSRRVFADLRSTRSPSQEALRIIKCLLYLVLGTSPRNLRTPSAILAHIKPHVLLVSMHEFRPTSSAHRRKKFSLVRRILRKINEDAGEKQVAADAPALSILFHWITAAVDYRFKRDEHAVLLKELGKEVDEEDELDDEDFEEDALPEDPLDRDPDDEYIRALEEQEKKQLLEEEEAAAALDEGNEMEEE